MKKQKGLGLFGVLLVIGALLLTIGGVAVWREKVTPTPMPTPGPTLPTSQITAPPTTGPQQSDSEATVCINTEGCSPYCGGCAHCPFIQLSPGQKVNIKGTGLSLTLLKITPSNVGYSTRQATSELEARSGLEKERLVFQTPGFRTLECGQHRVKDVFGFKILLRSVSPDIIELQVWRL